MSSLSSSAFRFTVMLRPVIVAGQSAGAFHHLLGDGISDVDKEWRRKIHRHGDAGVGIGIERRSKSHAHPLRAASRPTTYRPI